MEHINDEQSTPYVSAQTCPQVTIFHLIGMTTALTGSMLGYKYGLRHGGLLPAIGGTVTGFLIGGALWLPIMYLVIALVGIPEFIRSVAIWIFRKVLPQKSRKRGS